MSTAAQAPGAHWPVLRCLAALELLKLEPMAAPQHTFTRLRLATLVLPLFALLTGCADLGYYLQSVNGHISMMAATKPVHQWVADETTPQALKTRLELTQAIRRFAVAELQLPNNASYTRYADLKRSAVVWNVVAAPALSLTLKTWCFPVAGCVGYRGYFDEQAARALATNLQADGLEVSVYGVPAYSTLGWLNWAGGDPLLNTFIHYPEGELARLLIHEMTHQVVYAKGDTAFNESFATAVERMGADLWLARLPSGAAKADDDRARLRRVQFRALTSAARASLQKIYNEPIDEAKPAPQQTSPSPASQPQATEALVTRQLAAKQGVLDDFRAAYRQTRSQWQQASGLPEAQFQRQVAGYDQWVARVNNASLGAQAAYDDWVPAFEALFLHQKTQHSAGKSGQAWQAFYDEVQRLADLPKAERHAQLKRYLP